MASTLLTTNLPDLTLVSRGKVRDIYATSSEDRLLFIATDRISVYDVVLKNGIPEKGKLLTSISLFWFRKLQHIVPNHFITVDIDEMPEEVKQYRDQLEERTMLVKKAKVIPIEAIVRGYLTGSAWVEYKKSGTMHGIRLRESMVESEKFDEPIVTPSTKAEQGAHDENISPEKGIWVSLVTAGVSLMPTLAAQLIGEELYERIVGIALDLYNTAVAYALSCGLILADTKFEFGLVPSSNGPEELILVDEVLTPDSSRYWPLAGYSPGKPQPSFDKQYVRDYLTAAGYQKGFETGPNGNGEGWSINEIVIAETQRKYRAAKEILEHSS
ncbi:phosphoribosylaminoimidazole-succinocarboxamide synthase [Lanmaoa asiatica]|nr:phosphoribosylaminoimidazole-succinocarboxamide synthase [Lanmaoa asiatica]